MQGEWALMKALEKGVPTVEQWLSDALPQVHLCIYIFIYVCVWGGGVEQWLSDALPQVQVRLCLYVCGRWPG